MAAMTDYCRFGCYWDCEHRLGTIAGMPVIEERDDALTITMGKPVHILVPNDIGPEWQKLHFAVDWPPNVPSY